MYVVDDRKCSVLNYQAKKKLSQLFFFAVVYQMFTSSINNANLFLYCACKNHFFFSSCFTLFFLSFIGRQQLLVVYYHQFNFFSFSRNVCTHTHPTLIQSKFSSHNLLLFYFALLFCECVYTFYVHEKFFKNYSLLELGRCR